MTGCPNHRHKHSRHASVNVIERQQSFQTLNEQRALLVALRRFSVDHRIRVIKNGLAADLPTRLHAGPVMDNTGKTVLEKGTAANDKFLPGSNFCVKGVEGKVPGSNSI